VKLLTELTTLAASLVTVAICAAEGLDGRPATELFSASTDEVMALVWLGKSLLAELTSAVASLWIVVSCDFKPLTPLLRFKLVSPLTEFSRLVRSPQYPGLLLLQPASATTPAATTRARRTRAQVPPWRIRDLPDLALILIVVPTEASSDTGRRQSGVLAHQSKI
jgi:hypothetical protein